MAQPPIHPDLLLGSLIAALHKSKRNDGRTQLGEIPVQIVQSGGDPWGQSFISARLDMGQRELRIMKIGRNTSQWEPEPTENELVRIRLNWQM